MRAIENSRGVRLIVAAMLLCVAFGLTSCHRPKRIELTISAAASLSDALEEVTTAYKKDHQSVDLRLNLGSSGTLAHEIEEGAPADVFLSAASKPMDELQARNLIVTGSRRDLLRNSLVLIAPRNSTLSDFNGLAKPSVRVIALGDPASVPAGQYGEQTLEALHLWDAVQAKVVLGKDVRQVLAYVETGNADAGLVYATDAEISSKVRVVATAPESTHDAIVYPAAAVRTGRNEDAAREFVDFLASPQAKSIFVKRGFTIAAQ
jgi:molybdate transport system substrate-binding protein